MTGAFKYAGRSQITVLTDTYITFVERCTAKRTLTYIFINCRCETAIVISPFTAGAWVTVLRIGIIPAFIADRVLIHIASSLRMGNS